MCTTGNLQKENLSLRDFITSRNLDESLVYKRAELLKSDCRGRQSRVALEIYQFKSSVGPDDGILLVIRAGVEASRAAIRERLNQLRAEGLPIPDDLVELEKRLEEDYGA